MGLFDLFKAQAAPSPQHNKEFCLPVEANEFNYIYQFLVKFGGYNESPYTTIHINAYTRDSGEFKAGDVELSMSGETEVSEAIRRYCLSVYQFLFSNLSDGHFVKRFVFHEPDCYVYECPQHLFMEEATEYAPNAFVDFYQKYDNRLYISVKFRRYDDWQAAWENFKSHCDLWLR